MIKFSKHDQGAFEWCSFLSRYWLKFRRSTTNPLYPPYFGEIIKFEDKFSFCERSKVRPNPPSFLYRKVLQGGRAWHESNGMFTFHLIQKTLEIFLNCCFSKGTWIEDRLTFVSSYQLKNVETRDMTPGYSLVQEESCRMNLWRRPPKSVPRDLLATFCSTSLRVLSLISKHLIGRRASYGFESSSLQV